jgi:CO dehydrogenase maturation factor
MRVAFTGKGGSGKSTIAAVFIRHLADAGRQVLGVDADINVHLGDLLAVRPEPELALSRPENVTWIRAHLLGGNSRISGGVGGFVKTTPAGPGSQLVHLGDADPVLTRYALAAGDRVRFVHVGTYEPEGIGTSCYHTNLAILENLLSHLVLERQQWAVCDMVAGTDAFSNSLHAQFDLIVVVVEPTPESVTVALRYRELADAAGVGDGVVLVANKVADPTDRQWLTDRLGGPPLAELGQLPGLRRARQQGRAPTLADLPDRAALDRIAEAARTSPLTAERRAPLLRNLHLRLAEQGWIRAAHGDVAGQLGTHPDLTTIGG